MNRFLVVSLVVLLLLSIEVTAQDSTDTKNTVKRSFFEKGDFNGNILYQSGRVSDFNKNSDGSLNWNSPVYKVRSAIGLNLGIRLFELVYFRTTLFYNLNKNINAPWINTDYTYVLERVRWDPGTFSYGYSNYEVKKFSDNSTRLSQSFLRGSYYVRYYNQFPKNWLKALRIDTTIDLAYTCSIKYAIQYWDNATNTHGDLLHGKPVLNFTLRYVVVKNVFIEVGANYFPVSSTKANWDPDFTYAFGYNKYDHMTLAFSYGNYTTNRFPWNKQNVKGYSFLDGIFSLMLNFRW